MQEKLEQGIELRSSQFLIHYEPEVISIRQKITDPNKLLPELMIRSQPSMHMLPKIFDRQAQSGTNMPLDTVKTILNGQKAGVQTENLKLPRKSCSSKLMKKPVRIGMSISQHQSSNEHDDGLAMFEGHLRNMLKYPKNIIFISQTACSNVSHNLVGKINYKSRTIDNYSLGNTKDQIMAILESRQQFGSVCWQGETHYDRNKDKAQLRANHCFSEDQFLQFRDDMQSSNLFIAMSHPGRNGQTQSRRYLLSTRFDYNTKNYGQWFHFKVSRHHNFSFCRHGENNLFTFQIINMTKHSAMFGQGLKISVCRRGIWNKQGTNIRYYKNTLFRKQLEKDVPVEIQANLKREHYYTLQFSLEILEGEEIYVAYNQPYTYTRLGNMLDNICEKYESNQQKFIEFKRNIICTTSIGNNVELLTFTGKCSEEGQQEKKVIFITSRSHPVETAGSWVVEGIIRSIASLIDTLDVENIWSQLIQNYVIKIVPMLNPDGVILGNSRCNVKGMDLNRAWQKPSLDMAREIYQLKKEILKCSSKIEMFIDLHAHSKKKNVFAYGNHDFRNPFATREFPYLLSRLSKKDFLFSECRFMKLNEERGKNKNSLNAELNTGKQGTARVFLWDKLKIHNIFTIENSYCSAQGSLFHYDSQSYQQIGADILKAIGFYFAPNFKNRQNASKYQSSLAGAAKTEPLHQNEQCLSISNSKHDQFQTLRKLLIEELRANEDNIRIGLANDIELSDSEQEERIVQPRKQMGTTRTSRIKTNKSEKSEKIIRFLRQNIDTSKVNTNIANMTKGKTGNRVSNLLQKLPMKSLTRHKTQVEMNLFREFQPQTSRHKITLQGEKNEESQQTVSRKVMRFQRQPQSTRSQKQKLESSSIITERTQCLPIVQIGIDDCTLSNIKNKNPNSYINQNKSSTNHNPEKSVVNLTINLHLKNLSCFPIKDYLHKKRLLLNRNVLKKEVIDKCSQTQTSRKMHDEQVQQYLDKIVRLNLNHCKTSRGVQSTSPMKVQFSNPKMRTLEPYSQY